MIQLNNQIDFNFTEQQKVLSWISSVIIDEGFTEGEINYIFCSDEYLLDINLKHLNHDTYTDVISFDYSLNKLISGDIYISIERVEDNAQIFNVSFQKELFRVMIHGILHYCGYKDKTVQDNKIMRSKEDYYLSKL